jgi:hypothetical protein
MLPFQGAAMVCGNHMAVPCVRVLQAFSLNLEIVCVSESSYKTFMQIHDVCCPFRTQLGIVQFSHGGAVC